MKDTERRLKDARESFWWYVTHVVLTVVIATVALTRAVIEFHWYYLPLLALSVFAMFVFITLTYMAHHKWVAYEAMYRNFKVVNGDE